MKAALLTLFLFLSVIGLGQLPDSVLLLNGKVVHGDIIGLAPTEGDSVLKYQEKNKKGELETKTVEKYRIFSFYNNGVNRTVYTQDEFNGDYLTVGETQSVTIGSYDARQTFKPHFAVLSGFALGLGATLIDTYLTKKEASDTTLTGTFTPGFFKSPPSVFPFLIPPVVTVVWAFPTFKLKDKKIIHKSYKGDEYYYRGYHRIAKQRRMLGSLFGSLSGIAVGLILHYSFQ